MNQLTKVLKKTITYLEQQEKERINQDPYRLHFHLMPPAGWLNDPNGLSQYKGDYHVFFQYAPTEVQGGLKMWGHYRSRDLIHWEYLGVPLMADTPYDCHGVYSGSALPDKDGLHLYYTGNVKLEDKEYDYINDGRQAWTLHTVSRDGIHFEKKEIVLSPGDYPENYTCHIRDPKVWKENKVYYMILGGRKKSDQGAVLLYRSSDGKKWEYDRELSTEVPFGYMWECPDLFTVQGQRVLSVSPQGLKREAYRFQNRYQSGYFLLEKGKGLENFQEWDLGFDFYAPQTFEDEKGRRILIGWMGMPDAEEEYTNPQEGGWQHALTVPREIVWREGKLCQYPVEEIEKLRGKQFFMKAGEEKIFPFSCFDLILKQEASADCRICLAESLTITYQEGIVKIELGEREGRGRKIRQARLESLYEIRVLADTSAIEIYLNQGELVFTLRYYPGQAFARLKAETDAASVCLWEMGEMECV